MFTIQQVSKVVGPYIFILVLYKFFCNLQKNCKSLILIIETNIFFSIIPLVLVFTKYFLFKKPSRSGLFLKKHSRPAQGIFWKKIRQNLKKPKGFFGKNPRAFWKKNLPNANKRVKLSQNQHFFIVWWIFWEKMLIKVSN